MGSDRLDLESFSPDGLSPAGIGYGVNDPMNLVTLKTSGTQSYGITANRALPDNTPQFLVCLEGSSLGVFRA
jgi:hypothetical protein